jgi:biotin synthase
MSTLIGKIRARSSMAITLSVGERDYDTYRAWRAAGADRCLLRIETTEPELFRAIHPDDVFEERKQCLRWLREPGYQLGSGVMVGLPGQTPAMLARDVMWLHEAGAEMIGVGPFIPHPSTPLAGAQGGTVDQTLRLVAVLRLVLPSAHLPATTAMGTLEAGGRERALQAGANVMMPNITPRSYRGSYEIYPNKLTTGDDAIACAASVEAMLRSIGRTIATDAGHVVRAKAAVTAG